MSLKNQIQTSESLLGIFRRTGCRKIPSGESLFRIDVLGEDFLKGNVCSLALGGIDESEHQESFPKSEYLVTGYRISQKVTSHDESSP